MLVKESPADGTMALQATRKLHSLACRNRRGEGDHGLGRRLPGRGRTCKEDCRINGNSLRLCDGSDQVLHAGAGPLLIGCGSTKSLIPCGCAPDLRQVGLEYRSTNWVAIAGKDTPNRRDE
jgi:hypothetical protein